MKKTAPAQRSPGGKFCSFHPIRHGSGQKMGQEPFLAQPELTQPASAQSLLRLHNLIGKQFFVWQAAGFVYGGQGRH